MVAIGGRRVGQVIDGFSRNGVSQITAPARCFCRKIRMTTMTARSMDNNILRNNCLSGAVPEELAGLIELEVLDLGFNNFSGILPHEWGNNVGVLLLDNNGQFCHVPHEVEQLMMISKVQVEDS
ncbi:hypothetical protein V2J09_014034 [Rumex salicifolius]